MVTEGDVRQAFKDAARGWICDGYTVNISYVVRVPQNGPRSELWGAMVLVSAAPPREGIDFAIPIDDLVFGHAEYTVADRKELETFLASAALGMLRVGEDSHWLACERNSRSFPVAASSFEILSDRDAWFSPLHYRARSDLLAPFPTRSVYALDTALRRATPPFDGLADIARSLDISIGGPIVQPTVSIVVSPPADLDIGSSKLANNVLHVVLHAHPNLDLSGVDVSVREAPGKDMRIRHKISDKFTWTEADGRKTGVANIELENADSALVMLVVGEHTVRRHWFLDPTKAPNLRLMAMRTFDKDLKQLRHALFETDQSRLFEQAVSGLIFMLGFIPVAPTETDAPDLIVMTPGGQLVLVECTFKSNDVKSKIGKLVDRREALKAAVNSSTLAIDPIAVMVCRLPKQNIVDAEAANDHDVILVTREILEAGIAQSLVQNDPDQMVSQALARLRERPEPIVGSNTPTDSTGSQ